MSTIQRGFSPFLLATLLAASATASLCAQESSVRYELDGLAFMAGCWEGDLGDGTTIRETYTSPRGGAIFGNSQITAGSATQFYEVSRITADETGIHYRTWPSTHKAEVPFPLVRLSPTEAVFENPGHDFPQRIVYKVPAAGQLVASIEKMDGSGRQELPMKAVPCGGAAHQAALR